MPDHMQNQSNADSNSSNGPPIDAIEDGMKEMKVESKEEENTKKEEDEQKKEEEEEQEEGEQSNKYPDRPGEPDCLYYLRTGLCGYGSNCRFNHPPYAAKTVQQRSELPQREGQPDCGYYVKTGTCKYGSTCKYHHPLDRRGVGQAPLNTLGLPVRQEEKPCPYYMRNYTCKFGPACKFNHPELTPALSIPATGGNMGSPLSSNGMPYVGGVPAWSLTRSTYMTSSRVPGPPAYMPLVYPPLQGPVAAQSWNGYMGNLSTVSATNLMGTNLVYNTKNQGELATNGQVDLLTMTIPRLPDRPDQPECRYFMSTGSCKYGSNCKFHHPKEKIAQSAMTSLGPHGLPLRPGEDICAYFSSYGICKYGPTCKFNHPFGCYIPSYYFGMSSIPMDHSFFPNQRNAVIANSSETSQSKSSKITDWIQKPDTVQGKNRRNSETKAAENSHVDQQPNATATTSELPRDQVD